MKINSLEIHKEFEDKFFHGNFVEINYKDVKIWLGELLKKIENEN